MSSKAVIDVSALPDSGFDASAPLWWGNLLAILIETTTIILLLTSYYYIRRNFDVWPPPKPDPLPSMVDTRPIRGPGTANTVLLVASCLPMYLTSQAARRKRRWLTVLGLAALFLISLISLWIRCYEFPATHFSWGDNAYASIVWTTLGLHLTYILAGTGEFILMLAWLLVHDIDDKHALDVTLVAGYWYWVAGMWLPVYVTIYFGPSFL
jgi:cytochrome c oxidase subunit III